MTQRWKVVSLVCKKKLSLSIMFHLCVRPLNCFRLLSFTVGLLCRHYVRFYTSTCICICTCIYIWGELFKLAAWMLTEGLYEYDLYVFVLRLVFPSIMVLCLSLCICVCVCVHADVYTSINSHKMMARRAVMPMKTTVKAIRMLMVACCAPGATPSQSRQTCE